VKKYQRLFLFAIIFSFTNIVTSSFPEESTELENFIKNFRFNYDEERRKPDAVDVLVVELNMAKLAEQWKYVKIHKNMRLMERHKEVPLLQFCLNQKLKLKNKGVQQKVDKVALLMGLEAGLHDFILSMYRDEVRAQLKKQEEQDAKKWESEQSIHLRSDPSRVVFAEIARALAPKPQKAFGVENEKYNKPPLSKPALQIRNKRASGRKSFNPHLKIDPSAEVVVGSPWSRY